MRSSPGPSGRRSCHRPDLCLVNRYLTASGAASPMRRRPQTRRGQARIGRTCQGTPFRGAHLYRGRVSTEKEVREFLISRRANVTPEQVGLHRLGRGPTRARAAAGGGRRAGRGQPGLLLQAGTRPHSRRLRERAERCRPGPAAERRRTRAPVRPGPRRHRIRIGRAARRLPSPACGHRCNASWTAWPRRPSSTTPPRTSSRRTSWVVRCAHRTSKPRNPTWRGSSSSTLEPRTTTSTGRWPDGSAQRCCGSRPAANPLNTQLTALIGELSTLSPHFRRDWAQHDVHEHRTGRKIYRHPLVGDVEVTWDVFEMPGQPGLLDRHLHRRRTLRVRRQARASCQLGRLSG